MSLLSKSGLRLSVAFVALAAGCFVERRTPCRFLIPDGYVGWVQIQYGVEDASPVVTEGGFRVHKFPDTGIITTSSPYEPGHATDEFYTYDAESVRPLGDPDRYGGGQVWGLRIGWETGPESKSAPFLEFFVGSEQQYERLGFASQQPGPIGNLTNDGI